MQAKPVTSHTELSHRAARLVLVTPSFRALESNFIDDRVGARNKITSSAILHMRLVLDTIPLDMIMMILYEQTKTD
jgi:hypothetical protein